MHIWICRGAATTLMIAVLLVELQGPRAAPRDLQVASWTSEPEQATRTVVAGALQT